MTTVEKRLILTGWSRTEYVQAAALALRRWGGAQVLGASRRRLPLILSAARGYREILILGVELTGDVSALRKAVRKLAAAGTTTMWISRLPVPDEIPPDLAALLNPVVHADAPSLAGAVSRKLGVPVENVDVPRIYIDAALHLYYNYQNETFYPDVIRQLSGGSIVSRDGYDAASKQAIQQYIDSAGRKLVGETPVMKALKERIDVVAKKDRARVIIYGATGTGKETVAMLLHYKSPRKGKAFVRFNCAGVNPQMLESQFRGYAKGAFTDAKTDRAGLFEAANGGTLFLDEIGELPLDVQGVLLRVLQDGFYTRMGETRELRTDMRLIAATHRDLAQMVRAGTFREDLYYRLNVVPLTVPSLCDHKDDIPQLADDYWYREHDCPFPKDQVSVLLDYDWPGNVRELVSFLERADVLEETDFAKLLAEHRRLAASLAAPAGAASAVGGDEIPEDHDLVRRAHIRFVVDKYNGNVSRASKALGLAVNTVKSHLGSRRR